jgi:hypothetical protein
MSTSFICSVVPRVVPAVASDGLRLARDVQQTLSVPCVTKARGESRAGSIAARARPRRPAFALLSVTVVGSGVLAAVGHLAGNGYKRWLRGERFHNFGSDPACSSRGLVILERCDEPGSRFPSGSGTSTVSNGRAVPPSPLRPFLSQQVQNGLLPLEWTVRRPLDPPRRLPIAGRMAMGRVRSASWRRWQPVSSKGASPRARQWGT